MDEKSTEKELLTAIFKNAHIGLQAISDIEPETDNEEMKKELADEYEGYEKFISSISAYMKERGIETKDLNPMKKAMMYTAVKMDTIKDDSRSHVAEMMIKGTVTGITELGSLITANKEAPQAVIKFAQELKDLEECYEKRLKVLL